MPIPRMRTKIDGLMRGASRRRVGSMRATSPTAHNFLWNVALGELRRPSVMYLSLIHI